MLKYFLTTAVILIVATAVVWLALPPKAHDNQRIENPPPKPPNCEPNAVIPYLGVANDFPNDIRVIRVGQTRLFVPAKWLEQYFVDSQNTRSGSYFYHILEMFSPDIHSSECRGIEHILVPEGQTPRFGANRGNVVSFTLRGNFAPKPISGSDRMQGFHVTVQATKTPDGKIREYPLYSSTGNYWVKTTGDLFLTRVGRHSDAVDEYEGELRELGIWLTTHPNLRDNSRVFFAPNDF